MRQITWDHNLQRWDRFNAFYICVDQRGLAGDHGWNSHPMVVFDTGEAIFTLRAPRPDKRGEYRPLGVEVVTTKDYRGKLFAPDGQRVAIAWLYDGGQQTLLVDPDTKHVVRVADRWNEKVTVPGVPHRFQTRCSVYMPGPGLPPIGTEKLVAWLPFKEAGLTAAEKDHIQTIIDTARAALKLTDHPSTRMHVPDSIYAGCPLDHLLRCKTWQDVAGAHLPALYHHGAQRKRVEFDYLLTEDPRG